MKIDFAGGDSAWILGLMSGTSADAIECAVMEIGQEEQTLRWRLVHSCSVAWPLQLRDAILGVCRPDAPLQEVSVLNFRLGEEFARAAQAAADSAGLSLDRITAIASHGQTIWHQPDAISIAGKQTVSTVQIGEAAVIAARTHCIVVSDFRVADMALGGQGAPLAPFADFHLFANGAETRAVQNLGGIANVTYLPTGGALCDVIAFDSGPANMVMDAVAHRLTGGVQQCDRDGALAAAGRVDPEMLAILLQNVYFALPPPKSTGRERFGAAYADAVLAEGQARGLSNPDLMATVTALTVESIARAYEDFLVPRGAIQTVVLGGGGVRNPTLVSRLRERLYPVNLKTHSDFGMPDEAKEAAAFALLGYSTLHNRPSNVPSATGASGPAVLGKITLPPPRGD